MDVRPARGPQRVLQHDVARRRAGLLPRELLRSHGRRRQRDRRQRPLARPLAARRAAGRRRVLRPAAPEATPDGAETVLAMGATGEPEFKPSAAGTVLVEVPRTSRACGRAIRRCAVRWRAAVRDVLGGLLADGARVRGFDRRGWYVVDRGGAAREVSRRGAAGHRDATGDAVPDVVRHADRTRGAAPPGGHCGRGGLGGVCRDERPAVLVGVRGRLPRRPPPVSAFRL